MILTTNNRSVTFPAGYYPNFTVSTNILDIPGVVTYRLGHKHQNSCKKPSGTKKCGNSLSYHREEGGEGHVYYVAYCHGVRYQYNEGDSPSTTTCTYNITTYSYGCGYKEKQFVRETTDINTKTSTEEILSVTITY